MLIGFCEGLTEDTGARDDNLSDNTVGLYDEEETRSVFLSLDIDQNGKLGSLHGGGRMRSPHTMVMETVCRRRLQELIKTPGMTNDKSGAQWRETLAVKKGAAAADQMAMESDGEGKIRQRL